MINVISPEKGELEKLAYELHIPFDFLTDPLDIDERARIETEDGFLLIVLRLPKYHEDSDIPFTTFPAGIIHVVYRVMHFQGGRKMPVFQHNH